MAVYRENNTVCIIYTNYLLTICILYDIMCVKKDNLKRLGTSQKKPSASILNTSQSSTNESLLIKSQVFFEENFKNLI